MAIGGDQQIHDSRTNSSIPGMNYSVTGFQLVLTRKMSFYVVTYYLPSGLFVVVSWIRFVRNCLLGMKQFLNLFDLFGPFSWGRPQSCERGNWGNCPRWSDEYLIPSYFSFLVNPEIIPGRMTLLVTIFLVLINIHNTIQTNSPKVRLRPSLWIQKRFS